MKRILVILIIAVLLEGCTGAEPYTEPYKEEQSSILAQVEAEIGNEAEPVSTEVELLDALVDNFYAPQEDILFDISFFDFYPEEGDWELLTFTNSPLSNVIEVLVNRITSSEDTVMQWERDDPFDKIAQPAIINKARLYRYYELPIVEIVRKYADGSLICFTGPDYLDVYTRMLEDGEMLAPMLEQAEGYITNVEYADGTQLPFLLTKTKDDNLYEIDIPGGSLSKRDFADILKNVETQILGSELDLSVTRVYVMKSTVRWYPYNHFLFTDGVHEYVVFPVTHAYNYDTPGSEYIDQEQLVGQPQFVFEADRLYHLRDELVPFMLKNTQLWEDAYERMYLAEKAEKEMNSTR